MRFTVSSTALSCKLSALSRVINSKNSLPILGDFLERNERKQENQEKRQSETTNVTTSITTLQSDSSYVQSRYSSTNPAQGEGDIAQRGRHRHGAAAFRVGRPGDGQGGIREGQGAVCVCSRLARHRGGGASVLCGEAARGSSGRARAAGAPGERREVISGLFCGARSSSERSPASSGFPLFSHLPRRGRL